jgi:hypothetical protein
MTSFRRRPIYLVYVYDTVQAIGEGQIADPGEYVVLAGDKVPVETRVWKAGWHDVDLGGASAPASIFWKRAWDAGFRPLERFNEREFD